MTRILVVDDEPLVCEMVSGCFRNEFDAFVNFALTGPDGARLLRGYQFDLVVIDVVLPGVTGWELADLAVNENTPVLFTSGHPVSCDTLDRFCFPHLTKPFDLDRPVGEAGNIIRDTRDNICRVQLAAAQMHRHTAALKLALEESRRLMAALTAGKD